MEGENQIKVKGNKVVGFVGPLSEAADSSYADDEIEATLGRHKSGKGEFVVRVKYEKGGKQKKKQA